MTGMGLKGVALFSTNRRETASEKRKAKPAVVDAAVEDIVIVVVDGNFSKAVGGHADAIAGPRLKGNKLTAVEAVYAVPSRQPNKAVFVLEYLSNMPMGKAVALSVDYRSVLLGQGYDHCREYYRKCYYPFH